MTTLPRLLVTMGDVAGVGPEIIAKGWPHLLDLCRPVVVGDPAWLERALVAVKSPARVQVVRETDEVSASAQIVPCLTASDQDLRHVLTGCVTAAAGRAAYDFLCKAIDLTMRRQADGIVTAPLHKEGLRAAS